MQKNVPTGSLQLYYTLANQRNNSRLMMAQCEIDYIVPQL